MVLASSNPSHNYPHKPPELGESARHRPCPRKALAMLAAAIPRRSSGNWVAAASEISLSSCGGSFAAKVHPYGQHLPSENESHDCEPELIRITSLESEANTEALLRLFGRKVTQTRRQAPLEQVCEDETETESRLRPEVVHPSPPRPSTPPPDPRHLSLNAAQTSGADTAYPSPRDSFCSASSTPEDEEEDEAPIFRRTETTRGDTGKFLPKINSDRCQATSKQESTGAETSSDPTCAVDFHTWQQQSLQSILGKERCHTEAEHCSSPRSLLEGSLLSLISDPAVKARIRSLQLHTDVSHMASTFSEERALEGVPEDQGEECDGLDSPPVLKRSFTSKRESALEECWLTGEQRRRKFSTLGDALGVENEGVDVVKKRRC